MKEVVVIDAVRSPSGKAGWGGKKQGQLYNMSSQDLISQLLRKLVDRVKEKSAKFEEIMIEEVYLGCLSQIGEQGSNIARMACLLADLPDEVSGSTVNRYCNAGLSAVNWAAQNIMTGCGDVFIAGGVELMSHYGMGDDIQVAIQAGKKVVFSNDFAKTKMMTPQGVAAEMVAEQYNFTREQMDKFGLISNQNATRAWREGWFKDHVVPIELPDGSIVDHDETYRAVCLDDPEGAMAKMATLPPRFRTLEEGGRVTAGNSSQIVDGAAALIMMSKEKAKELGLKPLATIRGIGNAGGEPEIMLLSPIPASEKAMTRAGITTKDLDVIQPNEAFASPCMAFAADLGYDMFDERVNPTGGAIALGHPIGASGALYFGEMVHSLNRLNGRWGLTMLCGGGGCGIATVIQREDY